MRYKRSTESNLLLSTLLIDNHISVLNKSNICLFLNCYSKHSAVENYNILLPVVYQRHSRPAKVKKNIAIN